jgi:hypothetical protein
MQISSMANALAADIANLGGLGDDALAAAAEKLAAAMAAPITARLIEFVTEMAADLDASLGQGRVEVRLVGGDAELVLIDDAAESAPPDDDGDADADASARITLRLSPSLKAKVDAAAAAEGTSVNTYIIRLLGQRPRTAQHSPGRRRLSGYGRS